MGKKKQKKKFKINWLLLILFLIPPMITIMLSPKMDNDIWYLLSEGRYIVQNGIYHVDPLSIHTGLDVVVQNWLSASILWIIYNIFGKMGLFTLIILCNFAITYLLYKICMLISDNNKILSAITTFLTDITLCTYYIVTRPQIFSFIILLALIYVLELYVKTGDKKYTYWIPIFSIIEANMHASLWWMIFLYSLPYVIDSFKIPIINTQGYKRKPLLISLLVAFIAGLINPYGYKVITFIFSSFSDHTMHIFINELLAFNFEDSLCRHMFIIMLLIGIVVALFRKGNIRVRYICLFCGTLILGFISVKGFSHYCLVCFFPLAYFFKDVFPKDFDMLPKKFNDVLKNVGIIVGVFMLFVFCGEYIRDFQVNKTSHDLDEIMNIMVDHFDPETSRVYTSFNNGGYVEFMGYKAYIDPRAELYLKKNNHQSDIFQEFYDLQHGSLNYEEFINKYNFTHLIVETGDYLHNFSNLENYIVLYDNTNLGYKLYANKNLFSEEEINKIEHDYNQAIEASKNNQ